MESMNNHKEFVNRKDEITKLGKSVLTATYNTACVIHAPKGVGKTGLIEQVIKQYSQKHRCITVTPDGSTQSAQGSYIQGIFSGFLQHNTIEDIDRHFIKKNSKLYVEFISGLNHSFNSLSSLLKALAWALPVWLSLLSVGAIASTKFFSQYGVPIFFIGISTMFLLLSLLTIIRIPCVQIRLISKKKRLDVLEKIANTVSDKAFFLQLSYIESCLQKGGYLLHLRNVQIMDSRSQNALVRCLHTGCDVTIPNYFFLEYQSGGDFQVETFMEYIQQPVTSTRQVAIQVEDYCLSALSEEHIRELAGKLIVLDIQTEDDICSYWRNQACGNLYEINRFIERLDTPHRSLTVGEKFDHLTNQQKMVLLLFLFSSPHAKEIEVIEMTEGILQYTQADIKLLESDDLLFSTEIDIWQCNADIEKNWENLYQDYRTVRMSAESLYERFWWRRLRDASRKDSVQYHDSVGKLLRFYSEFSPRGMASLLTHLVQEASSHYDKRILKKYFSYLLVQYKKHGFTPDTNSFAIIACCYDLELYSQAWDFLALIPGQSEQKIAYTAMLLHCMKQYERAVKLCQEYCSADISVRLKLILKQVEFISWRMIYQPSQCIRLFEEIENTTEYRKYPEYGFFLRNAEILVSVEQSIKYLHRSILFFHRLRNAKNVGISLLTLGMQYARLGKCHRAIVTLLVAQKSLDCCNVFAKHYCFVDLAAAYLLKGQKNKQILFLLEKAELIAQTDFDRLVILSNKVAHCILTQDKVTFNILMAVIQHDSLPNVVQVRRSLFYNVSVMFQNIGDRDSATVYLQKSIECHKQVTAKDSRLPLNALWEARYHHSDAGLPQALKAFYRCPYHVSFITFWHFDIPDL